MGNVRRVIVLSRQPIRTYAKKCVGYAKRQVNGFDRSRSNFCVSVFIYPNKFKDPLKRNMFLNLQERSKTVSVKTPNITSYDYTKVGLAVLYDGSVI
ncbi:hypothetical protein OESDEN_05247 [Oesophagostomum dentatum]|uniref:Uncharacterized protein n=1 Tax=Oesophagostomum dentatum TaxID=61180 RepID=A0A0B1TC14_OESDE|nr:hypothetical protein OESDEN_05247 [Oesophagostomum dentatum]